MFNWFNKKKTMSPSELLDKINNEFGHIPDTFKRFKERGMITQEDYEAFFNNFELLKKNLTEQKDLNTQAQEIDNRATILLDEANKLKKKIDILIYEAIDIHNILKKIINDTNNNILKGM